MSNQLIEEKSTKSKTGTNTMFAPCFGMGMTKTRYLYGKAAFNIMFQIGSNRMLGTVNSFTYQEIHNLVKAAMTEYTMDEDEAAVVIFHGLRGGEIIHGIRIVHINKKNNAITPPLDNPNEPVYPTHEFSSGVLTVVNHTNWKNYQDEYYTQVEVNRTLISGQKKVDPLNDPKAVIYLWQNELKKLFTDNDGANQDLKYEMIDYSDHLTYACHGNIFTGPEGFRHSVAFYLVTKIGGEPILSDDKNGLFYNFKGLDYGNLCPPRSSIFLRR